MLDPAARQLWCLCALTDTAIWYHRAIDLQARFGNVTDGEQLDERLRASFIQDLGLTDEEIALLFDVAAKPLAGETLSDVLRDEVADPQAYLPDLGGDSGELQEMIAAVDETTYMFSPKVLDRANVVEFRMDRGELVAFLAAPRSPEMDELNGRGSGFGAAFVGESGKALSVPDAGCSTILPRGAPVCCSIAARRRASDCPPALR